MAIYYKLHNELVYIIEISTQSNKPVILKLYSRSFHNIFKLLNQNLKPSISKCADFVFS